MSLLEGNFKILEMLGKGTYSVVFKCISNTSSRLVTIKKIEIPPAFIDEVDREVGVLEHIKDSKYLLSFDYHIRFDSCSYIISTYLNDYITLDDFIDKDKNILIKNKQYKDYHTIFTNLNLGLRELHDLNVTHRDIKLLNILINTNTFDIKYIDYGNSCLEEDIDEVLNQEYLLTTYPFSDPYTNSKIINKMGNVTFDEYKKSDIYSLGMVIYMLVGGKKSCPYSSFLKKFKGNIKKFVTTKYSPEILFYSEYYDYNNSDCHSVKDDIVDEELNNINEQFGTKIDLHIMLNDDIEKRRYL